MYVLICVLIDLCVADTELLATCPPSCVFLYVNLYVDLCVSLYVPDTELLATYPPIADDTQKAFLFLSSFSLIGALDKYSKGNGYCRYCRDRGGW